MSHECISVERARNLIASGNARVIDIRDPASFNAGHIKDAERVDDNNIEEFLEQANFERPLIVCCYHGNMSKGAADYFSNQGFQETYSLDGGYVAWEQFCVE